jgi:hypothetical protein
MRAAAALALGATGGSDELLETSEGDAEPLVAAAALRARSEHGVSTPRLEHALASALLAADDFTRQAAVTSAVRLYHGGAPLDWTPPNRTSEAGSPEAADPAAELGARLIGKVSDRELAEARLGLDAALRAATLELLESPGTRRRAVLTRAAQSAARSGRAVWSALDPSVESGDASLDARLAAAERSLGQALAPALLALVHDEDSTLGALALTLLPALDEGDARVRAAYREALFGEVEALREAALERMARDGSSSDIALLAELGRKSHAWSVRRRVAVLLADLSQRGPGPAERAAIEAALTQMSRDENPLVARAARRTAQ